MVESAKIQPPQKIGILTRPPKGEKKGGAARDGSKAAKILELLKRPGGATSKELMKATGWQQHSVRGFLSGTIKKKMGLKLESSRREGEERAYRLRSK